MIMTWYDEEQITTLLGDAGYRDVRIETDATTGTPRSFRAPATCPVCP